MEGFIILDLTKYNYKSLDRLVTESGLYDVLTGDVLAKQKADGIAKIFIHEATRVIIGFTTKKERNNFQLTEYGLNLFLSSESFTLSKFQKDSVESDIKEQRNECDNLDDILDKISKYGRNSLTKSEIRFLQNFSN